MHFHEEIVMYVSLEQTPAWEQAALLQSLENSKPKWLHQLITRFGKKREVEGRVYRFTYYNLIGKEYLLGVQYIA